MINFYYCLFDFFIFCFSRPRKMTPSLAVADTDTNMQLAEEKKGSSDGAGELSLCKGF